MSGEDVIFQAGEDADGIPALTGHFDAPLPGLYYVTLNMTSGAGASQMNYSRSFWVTYEAKPDRHLMIQKVNRDFRLDPPYYLPDAWRKTSNTLDAEDLELTMDEKSVKITPTNFASLQIDPKNPQSLIIHSLQKGEGTLSFVVTTEYGDKWTINYDVVVKR